MAWVALWRAFLHTMKCSFLMISPKLHDFSPFFFLISSPLGTAGFLVLLELSVMAILCCVAKKNLQTTMAGRPPRPTRHNSAPAPSTLPEELLLARFVLVRRDGAQPPLSPVYNEPYRVLERSTHFFFLEIVDRTDKVSTPHQDTGR